MPPINIDANLGAKGFISGAKDMEKALENVSDELENVAKSGDQDVEKLADKLKEADKAAKALKESGSDIGKGVKKGTVEAEDATEVYKKEAIANVSEVTSSFTGSWESAVDVVQGTLGGVVADLGAFGAVAGAAGALAVGVAGEIFRKMEEDAKAAEQRITDLSKAFIATRDMGIPLEKVIENLQNITTNSQDAKVKFKDLQTEAKKIGIAAEGLATAYAGGSKELDTQLKMLQLLEKQSAQNIEEQRAGNRELDLAESQRLTAIRNQIKGLQDTQKEIAAAQEAEKLYLSTGAGEMQNKVDAIKGINDAYDDAVGSVLDFVNKENGVLDVAAYIKSMEERGKALETYQTSLLAAGLTPEQKTALNDMGVDASIAWMKGFESATPEQKEKMKTFLTESAKDSSGVAKAKVDEIFKTPIQQSLEIGMPTDIELHKQRKNIEDIIGKSIKIPITFEQPKREGSFTG